MAEPNATPEATPAATPAASATGAATPAAAAAASPAPTKDGTPASSATVPAGDKVQEPAAAKPTAPEKYEFAPIEGALLDAAAVERTAAHARSLGLSQEQAQSALAFANAEVAAFVAANNARWETLTGVKADPQGMAAALSASEKPWVEQLKADKEIGGKDMGKNVELARRVLAKFSTPDFAKMLDSTGYGNHPELVRTFVRIGKTMAEDSLILPNQGGGDRAPRDAAEVLYGSPATTH